MSSVTNAHVLHPPVARGDEEVHDRQGSTLLPFWSRNVSLGTNPPSM